MERESQDGGGQRPHDDKSGHPGIRPPLSGGFQPVAFRARGPAGEERECYIAQFPPQKYEDRNERAQPEGDLGRPAFHADAQQGVHPRKVRGPAHGQELARSADHADQDGLKTIDALFPHAESGKSRHY